MSALAGLAGLHAGCAAVPQRPLLGMQLVDRDSGRALAQYRHRGRRFSPGAPGARYAIRLGNEGGERLLVVLSVDGVNAITGETAAWEQSGYVLEAGESFDIAGWRKSDERIAAFEFTSLGDSYAARTGRPAHVGVIGAAVFREVATPVAALEGAPAVAPPLPAAPRMTMRLNGTASDAAGAVPEARAGHRLGTGHGASEWSPLLHTSFQRRTRQPEQLLEIHYDSEVRLVAAGVMPRPVTASPRSFPGSGGSYVPDPPARW